MSAGPSSSNEVRYGKTTQDMQKQFLQQGLHLLFSFDTSIAPGVIIERRRARDVNLKGSIDKFKGAKLTVLGPADLGLMEFSRVHELNVEAGAELIGGGAVGSTVKRARTVKLSLGNPVSFLWTIRSSCSLASQHDPSWPTSAQAESRESRRLVQVGQRFRARHEARRRSRVRGCMLEPAQEGFPEPQKMTKYEASGRAVLRLWL